ncbi:hypothetical protein OC842_001057 [Tilletia horrida]|uniref:Uncharacterized protein n=1 Tax=Tilletia horrida TaxID=155126 RepID=A0AAN6GIK8_9BASI|nr:hypothetical protein OC842_001057 [Tilletia horrida]
MAIGQKIVLPPDNPSRAGRGPPLEEDSGSARSDYDEGRHRHRPTPPASAGSIRSRRSESQRSRRSVVADAAADERTPLIRSGSASRSRSGDLASEEATRGAAPIVSYDAVHGDRTSEVRSDEENDDEDDQDDFLRGDSIPPPPYSDANAYWVRRRFGPRSHRSKWIMRSISLSLFSLFLVLGTTAIVLWLDQSGYFRDYPKPVLPEETLPRHFANWTRPEAVVPEMPPRFKTGLYVSSATFPLPANMTHFYIRTRGGAPDAAISCDTRPGLTAPVAVVVAAYSTSKLFDALAVWSEFDDAKPQTGGLIAMTSDELQLTRGQTLGFGINIHMPPADAYKIRDLKVELHSGQLIFNMHPETRTDTITIDSPMSNIDIQSDLVARSSFRLSALFSEIQLRSTLAAPTISMHSSSIFLKGGKMHASKSLGIRTGRFSANFDHLAGPSIDINSTTTEMHGNIHVEAGNGSGLNIHASSGRVDLNVGLVPSRSSGEQASRNRASVNVSITNGNGNTSVVYSRWHPQRPITLLSGGIDADTAPAALWQHPLPYLNSMIASQSGSIRVEHDASFVGAFALVGESGGPAELCGPGYERGYGGNGGGGGGDKPGFGPQQRVLEVQTDRSKGSRVWIKGVVREVEDERGAGVGANSHGFDASRTGRRRGTQRGDGSGRGRGSEGDVSEVHSDSGKMALIFD